MKTSKSTVPNPLSAKPFFNKKEGGNFFSASLEKAEPFFSPPNILTQLSTNQPGDNSEQETDEAAERRSQLFKHDGIQAKGENCYDIDSPIIQNKSRKSENKKAIPNPLKSGLESLSGLDLSNIKVHYNDAKAAQYNALAYTKGQDIHLAPKQEQHLSHEGWHVVQQMQGRVRPTMQLKGDYINDQKALEKEADDMGAKALQFTGAPPSDPAIDNLNHSHSKSDDTTSGNLRVALNSHNQNVIQRVGNLAAVLEALEDNDWDVDSLTAELSDEQMATISASNRLRLITYIANGFSVANEDEQTILRLFSTTPSVQRSTLVDDLTPELLQRLESVIHGDEYREYHVLIRGLFFGARSAGQAVEEIESARTFPWADPGLIRAIWNVRFYYEVAEFTDEGRLRFVYWTNIAMMGMRNEAVEVDPMEMILVRFYDDETEAGASRDQTMPMPAINLLSLVQSQFRGEMQTVADVAMIGLGGAGLLGATTRLGRAIAALELAFGTADVLVRDFRNQIARTEQGREFLAVWDIVSVFIAIYGFTRLAIEGGRIFIRLRRAWRAIRGSDDVARLGSQVDDVLDQADEVRTAQQETSPTTPEGTTPSTEPTTPSTPEGTMPSTEPTPTPRADVRQVPSTVRASSGVDIAIEADRLEHVLRAHTVENFDPVARAAEIVSQSPTDPTTFIRRGTVTNPRELFTLIRQALEGTAGRQVIAGVNNEISLTIRNQRMTVWVGPATGGGMRMNSIYPVAARQSLTATQVRAYAAEINAGTRTLDQIRSEIVRLLQL